MFEAVVSVNGGQPAEVRWQFVFQLVETGWTFVPEPLIWPILFELVLKLTVNVVKDF